ncbi:hypothetical protein SAMN02910265_02114 [Ruminococcus flavefaciens]|uniref:Uncharacterized protein n=1 Tax=Ruminococcus flavefaciens TaxID=1265 RepID=A0A1H6K670_RUMFL|nr:hypothetical protein [Ruminococcus flavefaciens]SEH68504.1 hypothetical protein SAMN02910265_02114 [Ruminococcus flavefaciens]
MLWSIIIPPIIFFISLSIMNICDKKYSDNKKKDASKSTMKNLAAALGCLICAMVLLSAVTSVGMIDGNSGISLIGSALTSAAVFGAVLARRYKAPRIGAFLKKSAICACVILAAEVLIFNGKSFTSQKTDQTLSTSDITLGANAESSADNDISVTGDSDMKMYNIPEDARVLLVSLDAEGGSSTPFDVKLSMTDKNFSTQDIIVQHKRTCGRNSELSLCFEPYEKLNSLTLTLSGVTKTINIHKIRALSAVPYSFSDLRFILLYIIVIGCLAIKAFGFYAVDYDSKKRSHVIAVAAVIVLCTLSGLCLRQPDQEGRPYTGTEKYTDDPFAMTLDAFEKDQVYLDLDADPALDELENVYDSGLRGNSQAFAYWDLAYYNGKYYSYFGVAPVLTFYYPYYKLTGKLPTLAMANNFYTVIGILFMCLTVLAALKLLKIKPKLLLLLLMLPTAAATMGFWTLGNEIDRYTLPTISGLCFLMISLFTGMTACTTANKKLKPVLLIIGGTALALSVASRPTVALCGAVLVPFFIGILLDKKEKLGYRLGLAASFVAPLIAGAALIMKYNAARFGSPFDFGAAYQLTVSDIHANTLRLSNLPSAIYHYFLQMPKSKPAFPFFETGFNGLENYGSYVYTVIGFGALTLPVILFGTLLQPQAFGPKTKELGDRCRRWFLAICLAMSVFLAWADFCLGGFITHYVFDIMPLMTFAAMIGIFRGCSNPSVHKSRYVLSGISMALTMVFIFGQLFNWGEGTIMKHFPSLIDTLEDAVIFWK